MGQRKSKPSKTSYDIAAPEVSERDSKTVNNQNNIEKKEGNGVNSINESTMSTKTITNENKVTSSSPSSSLSNQTEAQKDAEKTFDPKLIPSWLKAELFVDILKANLPDFESIKEFKAYPALSAGENYASLMLRVSIDAELKDKSTKNISFMLKVPHDTEQMKQMLEFVNFFISENGMYLDILPEMEQMYKDAGVDITLSAKAYKLPEGADPNYVLLQDLRPSGYKNANRRECLDLEHAHWVLKKLAQYHAASATRVAKKGPYSDTFMKGVFTDQQKAIALWEGMMSQFRDNFLNNVKQFKDGDKYEPYLKTCLGQITKNLVDLANYDENDFNVLGHGDCWTNNILFKYNDAGEVIDMIFVDYQMSKYDSPAHDLWYFIISSLKLDIKLDKFEYLIRYYYDHLIESLKLLNYPKKLPALREIYIQLYKYGAWSVFSFMVILPVVLLDPTSIATMENFMASDADGVAFKNALFSNKRYHEHINELLPWLFNRGMLETYDYKLPIPSVDIVNDNKVETQIKSEITEKTLSLPAFQAPDWVKESIFVDVLKQHFKDFKNIKSFKTGAATSGGDHYASSMVKVDIDLELENNETRSVSYMLKIALDNTEANAMLEMMNTFDKEIAMYTEFLPKFQNLYKAAGVDICFAPDSFDLPQKPMKNALVLENLHPKGFKNADRLAGLDETHVKAVLKKLAQYHAASACYAVDNNYPQVVKKNMFNEEARPFFEKMKALFTDLFFECITEYPNQEQYKDKTIKINDRYVDIILDAVKINENGFNVLNHGDVWTNNILFQYDDNGQIKETYLIDYQIVNYGSPAYDLYYFLTSSPKLDIKVDKFDHHIRYYHDNLVENLKLLNYPKHIPTLKELHEELIQRGALAFSTVLGVMSAVLLDPSEQANMENMLSEADIGRAMRKQMYNNKRYSAHADALLVWLNNRGLLDYDVSENVRKDQTDTEGHWSPPIFKVPDWVNESNFNDVLESHVKGFKKITNLKAEIATKAGDNYASVVLKVDVEAELQDGSKTLQNYILKTPPEGEQTNFLMEMWNSFKKETEVYNKLIPEFESMYKEKELKIKFAPNHYELKKDIGSDYVLLENLQVKGFKMADRLESLDIKHTENVLKKLAQFHAASVKYLENGKNYPKYFEDGMYNERSREMFEQIMQGTNPTILAAIESYEGYEEYSEKVPHLLDVFLDKIIELDKVDATEFNVLNHADCWVNNIMFQYNENGELKETYLLDYQDCKYGSPALDLYYFLISSTKLDIKIEKFDYLIKFYHDNLLEHLKLLEYKGFVPSLKQLHEILIKYGLYGVSTIWGVTSLCLLDPTENISIEAIVDETDISKEIRTNMYTNPRYKAHAEQVLLWLNRRGSLDF